MACIRSTSGASSFILPAGRGSRRSGIAAQPPSARPPARPPDPLYRMHARALHGPLRCQREIVRRRSVELRAPASRISAMSCWWRGLSSTNHTKFVPRRAGGRRAIDFRFCFTGTSRSTEPLGRRTPPRFSMYNPAHAAAPRARTRLARDPLQPPARRAQVGASSGSTAMSPHSALFVLIRADFLADIQQSAPRRALPFARSRSCPRWRSCPAWRACFPRPPWSAPSAFPFPSCAADAIAACLHHAQHFSERSNMVSVFSSWTISHFGSFRSHPTPHAGHARVMPTRYR